MRPSRSDAGALERVRRRETPLSGVGDRAASRPALPKVAGHRPGLAPAQVDTAIAAQVACPRCGRARRHKDTGEIVVRSLFGRLRLPSPRWWHCDCQDHSRRTFQPLAEVLPERITPELAYLQARFAGLVSYGVTAKLLGELLPLGRRLHPAVVRRHTQAVAQRLEDELGDERFNFIDTCQRDVEELPRPDLPLTVGLDGGYVHSGWFEVITWQGRSDFHRWYPNLTRAPDTQAAPPAA